MNDDTQKTGCSKGDECCGGECAKSQSEPCCENGEKDETMCCMIDTEEAPTSEKQEEKE